MGRVRSTSSPPGKHKEAAEKAEAAWEKAEASFKAAREAAAAAAEACRAASAEPAAGTQTPGTSSGVPYPAAPLSTAPAHYPTTLIAASNGDILWYARTYPGLEDGIYTYVALRNRAVNPEAPSPPSGLLAGYKTERPLFKKSYEWGLAGDRIFWR